MPVVQRKAYRLRMLVRVAVPEGDLAEHENALVAVGDEKALVAERDIAYVRLAVILFNIAVYWPLMRDQGIPWLALLVTVVAVTYAFYVVMAKPYLHHAVLRAAMFTAVTDALLISLWILATGGFDSPFYLLWYLSLVAVAFRYDLQATFIATGLYVGCYVVLLTATEELLPNLVD